MNRFLHHEVHEVHEEEAEIALLHVFVVNSPPGSWNIPWYSSTNRTRSLTQW